MNIPGYTRSINKPPPPFLTALHCSCTTVSSCTELSQIPTSLDMLVILKHCNKLHCTVLHCTALHCTALHCTLLQCTALHNTALHCTALHNTALHYTALLTTFLCVVL